MCPALCCVTNETNQSARSAGCCPLGIGWDWGLVLSLPPSRTSMIGRRCHADDHFSNPDSFCFFSYGFSPHHNLLSVSTTSVTLLFYFYFFTHTRGFLKPECSHVNVPLLFCFSLVSVSFFLFFLLSVFFVPPSHPTQHYFVDAWNTFDALIVVGSVVDIAITEANVSKALWFLLFSCTALLCSAPSPPLSGLPLTVE